MSRSAWRAPGRPRRPSCARFRSSPSARAGLTAPRYRVGHRLSPLSLIAISLGPPALSKPRNAKFIPNRTHLRPDRQAWFSAQIQGCGTSPTKWIHLVLSKLEDLVHARCSNCLVDKSMTCTIRGPSPSTSRSPVASKAAMALPPSIIFSLPTWTPVATSQIYQRCRCIASKYLAPVPINTCSISPPAAILASIGRKARSKLGCGCNFNIKAFELLVPPAR